MNVRSPLCAWTLLAAPLAAQEGLPLDLADHLLGSLEARFGDEVVLERFGQDTAPGRISRLLEDVDLLLEAVDETPRGGVGLGFEYGLAKRLFDTSETTFSSIDFVASGNVAFDANANPDDYQSIAFRVRWYGSKPMEASENLTERSLRMARLGRDLADVAPEAYARLAERYPGSVAVETLRADPEYVALEREAHAAVLASIPNELVWDFDVHAGMEANQEFSERQVVLGAAVAARVIDWDGRHEHARFNVFDWPAATLRWLLGWDEAFSPSIEALPGVVASIDVVDGSEVSLRGAADQDTYLRWGLDFGWRSRLGEVAGQELGLTARWRVFEEFDAPSEIRDAGIDGANHLKLALDLPGAWELAYTTGRLPLDPQDDSTFALGYRVRW